MNLHVRGFQSGLRHFTRKVYQDADALIAVPEPTTVRATLVHPAFQSKGAGCIALILGPWIAGRSKGAGLTEQFAG